MLHADAGIAGILSETGDEPGGEERVPAEVREEIGLGGETSAGEELGEQPTQGGFMFGSGGRSLRGDRGHEFEFAQSAMIDLPGTRPGHALQDLDAGGYHVDRQALRQGRLEV